MLKIFNICAVSENIHTNYSTEGFGISWGWWKLGGGGICETKQIKEMQIKIFIELYNEMFLVSAGADL